MEGKELMRYNRQVMLKDFGEQGQEKLKAAKVLVVGAGGLGTPVLQYLCAAGIGILGLVDNDVVSETNLQRQVLYATNEIDFPKVDVAKKKLNALNPYCKINTYQDRLNEKNALKIISLYDIVVDCTDNFNARYLLDEVCAQLEKPLVYGSIEEFTGQVTVFHYKKGISYQLLFPEQPDEQLMNGQPLGVVGAIPGVIGSIQAVEVLKIITGVGKVLSGRLQIFNALDGTFRNISFAE